MELVPRTNTERYLERILERLDRIATLLGPPTPTEAPKPGPAKTGKATKTP